MMGKRFSKIFRLKRRRSSNNSVDNAVNLVNNNPKSHLREAILNSRNENGNESSNTSIIRDNESKLIQSQYDELNNKYNDLNNKYQQSIADSNAKWSDFLRTWGQNNTKREITENTVGGNNNANISEPKWTDMKTNRKNIWDGLNTSWQEEQNKIFNRKR